MGNQDRQFLSQRIPLLSAARGQIENCKIALRALQLEGRTRMVQTSFGFNGRFRPMRRPLFRGVVCGEGMRLSLIMVVSREAHPFQPKRRIAVDRLRNPKTGGNAGSR
jgi:hypothetical protein